MCKTILIDLDGVLNTYAGNFKEYELSPPRAGVENFLQELSQNYKIEIFTVRNKKVTLEWLQKYQLDKYIYDITNVKNHYVSIIIDDRALNFNGDFNKTLAEIKDFAPYWAREC